VKCRASPRRRLDGFRAPSSGTLTKLDPVAQIFSGRRSRGRQALFGCAVVALSIGIDAKTAPPAMADPPYQNCDQARADGRWSIPYTDPAYSPELDLDGDGLACEPGKAHRSRR
jgi:hypothetical protein